MKLAVPNIVKKAFGLAGDTKAFSLNSDDAFEFFGGRVSYSGVNVSGRSGLYVPAVLQAVRIISETVGSLPCKLYRDVDGSKAADKTHDAYRIVHCRANADLSAGALRERLTRDALLHGHGFARVQRYPGEDRPFELYRIPPDRVTVEQDDITGFRRYRVTDSDAVRVYDHTEILAVSAFDGTSPLNFGKEAIGLAAILERHGAQFFGSGARPSGVFMNEKAQGDEAGAKAIANMRASYDRWKQDGGPLFLDRGWKFEQTTMTSTDAQFIENRKFQIEEIARLFGVPPHLLFHLDRATWSNAETMGASFLQLCLRRWLDRWQDAYSAVLLNEDEQDGCFFEFVVDDLLRADAASRADVFGKLIAMRAMTPNEVRAAMNLPALPGGDDLANPYTSTSSTAPTSAAPLPSASEEAA